MDKKVTAKTNMFTQVENFLEENQTTVDAVPALKECKTHLNTGLDYIQLLMQQTSLKTTGNAKDKHNAKMDLCTKLFNMCEAAGAFAMKTNNMTLADKVNYSESRLAKIRSTDLAETAQALYNVAYEIKDDLVPWDVKQEDFTDLDAAIQKYAMFNPKPRASIISGKTKRSELREAVRDLNNYLRKEMDKTVGALRKTYPNLYELYMNARRNYSAGVRHRKPVPLEPVMEAAITGGVVGVLEKAVQEMALQEPNEVTAGALQAGA